MADMSHHFKSHSVGILGSGAMGLRFAALLHDAGFGVQLVDSDDAVVSALQDGFSVEGGGGGLLGAECATSAEGRYCLPVSQDTA
ncbi:MAG: hypothetical protein D6B26_02370, partial [Spirochaetaceae bacterium]